MISKKGIYSFFSQVRWSKQSLPRANGRIRQFESTFGIGVKARSISALDITGNETTTVGVVRKVRKGFQITNFPIIFRVTNPPTVRSKLFKVTNHWFDQVPNAAVGRMQRSFRIPLLWHGNSFIRNSKILSKELMFQASKLLLESFASCFLLVPIATNVRPRQADSKGARRWM